MTARSRSASARVAAVAVVVGAEAAIDVVADADACIARCRAADVDLSSRRGRPQGMEPKGNLQIVREEIKEKSESAADKSCKLTAES